MTGTDITREPIGNKAPLNHYCNNLPKEIDGNSTASSEVNSSVAGYSNSMVSTLGSWDENELVKYAINSAL